jgi:hypothetical protein
MNVTGVLPQVAAGFIFAKIGMLIGNRRSV